MMTGITGNHLEGDPSHFLELEYGRSDFLLQSDLARTRPNVGSLNLATDGRPQRSARWRELFEPVGLHDQLRGALVSPTGCWGFFSLCREKNEVFSASEVSTVAVLLRALADGLRVAVLREKAQRPGTSRDPALLILSDDMRVVEASDSAQHVFARPVEIGGVAPTEILAVAVRAKLAMEKGPSGPLAMTRVGDPNGWLRVQAIPLAGEEESRIAVIVEHARPADVAELTLQAHDLTRREAEVTRHVLAGCSTDEIAHRLHVSPLTVQQHLKSVFGKLGVGSRRELIATLFFKQVAH
jgi:DNA-binding CsgD family transcriptional regulator